MHQGQHECRKLLDGNSWPAASHAKDSKALNRNFGTVNKVVTTELKQLVNALIQSSQGTKRDKSNDECRLCGQKGHWERECPTKKKGFGAQQSKSKRADANRGKSKQANSKGKHNPPKAGESEIKVIDGKKKHWCAKCKRWTLSHGTETHKSKEELQKQAVNTLRVGFDMQPSAYKLTGPDFDKPMHNQETFPKIACDLLNHLPSESTGRSPLEIFSRQSYSIKRLQDFHAWGCPVYVLDSTLQDGKKLPRWKSRSSITFQAYT